MRRIPPAFPLALALTLLSLAPASAAPNFGAPVRYACPGTPELTSIAAGDIDEDGLPDLVGTMGATWNHPMFWFRGAGSGAFGAVQALELYTGYPNSVALGRFRGASSHLDLAMTLPSGIAWIVPGNGDGTFSAATASNYPVGLAPAYVKTGHVNGDAALDVMVVNRNSNTVCYYLGAGDLTFGTPAWFGTGVGPGPVTQADMDNDGLPDFALSCYAPGFAHVVRCDPTSRDYYPRYDYSAPGAVTNAVGDFTGDGVPDMAVSMVGQVRILQNNGFGVLALRAESYTAGGTSLALAAADLDGDGDQDLVRANLDDSTLSVWSGNGDGTLGTRTDYVVGASPWTLALADLDNDGDLDLAVGCNAEPFHVTVLLNQHVTGVPPAAAAPTRVALLPPQPNPARSGATLGFDLPAPTTADLRIVDVQGRTVRRLATGARFAAGRSTLAWDGLDASGRPAPAGLYFVHLRSADGTEDARKLELVR